MAQAPLLADLRRPDVAMSCCGEIEKDPEEDNVTRTDEPKQFGPAPNRGCTDCWCLLVLLACWVAYFVVTIAGVSEGNMGRLYEPRDYMGNYCNLNAAGSELHFQSRAGSL